MDYYDWSTKAKVVWIVDAVGVAIDTLLVVTLCVGAVLWGPIKLLLFLFMLAAEDFYKSDHNYVPPKRLDEETMSNVKLLVWLGLELAIVFCLIEIHAVRKLAIACKQRCHVLTAVKNALFWIISKIVFSGYCITRVLGVFQPGLNVVDVIAIGKLFGNVVGLVIVQNFMAELIEILVEMGYCNDNVVMDSVDSGDVV